MRVSFVQLGVCEGSGTSRRSGQDARERCLGAGRSSGSGLLRQTGSGAESKKRVASHGKLVGSEWVCHFHQVFFYGDGVVGPGVIQEEGPSCF